MGRERDLSCEMEVDIVLGHADLLWHLDDLDLDIDLEQALGQRIDLDQTWIDGACESAELGNQTDVTLRNWSVRVWTNDAARDCAEGSKAVAQSVNHGTVPAMLRGIFGVRLDDLRIRWLKVFTSGWLNLDNGLVMVALTV